MDRKLWIPVINEVVSGWTEGLHCPERDGGVLEAEWHEYPAGSGQGEYVIRCPECDTEVAVRISRADSRG